MNDWIDSILSDLEDYLVRPDGSPAALLRIFSAIISKTGPMVAETPEEHSALYQAAAQLMDMFPGGSDAVCDRLQEMKEVLAMWDFARDEGIPFNPHPLDAADRSELLTLREDNAQLIRERNELEAALQQLKDSQPQNTAEAPAEAEDTRSVADDPIPQSDPIPAPDPRRPAGNVSTGTAAPADPFASIPFYLITQVDLGANRSIPNNAEHLVVTQAAQSSDQKQVVKFATFYDLTALKTVEFDCHVDLIEGGAFFHNGDLALKFRNPGCVIHPGAFSEKTRITLICAPPGGGMNSPQYYARANGIPFIPC